MLTGNESDDRAGMLPLANFRTKVEQEPRERISATAIPHCSVSLVYCIAARSVLPAEP
jgi:hypothetical protein